MISFENKDCKIINSIKNSISFKNKKIKMENQTDEKENLRDAIYFSSEVSSFFDAKRNEQKKGDE